MDLIMLVLFLLVLALPIYYIHISNSRHRNMLPPGPCPYPLIGNILQLGHKKPHDSLAKLSKTYGPLMSIHLGSLYTVIVTSPEMAKEILLHNDKIFSGRMAMVASQAHDHHNNSVGFLPVGKHWNKLRRVCKEKIFSFQCLEASQILRQEKLRQLGDYVNECCLNGKVVGIGRAVFTTTINLMSFTLVSADFSNYGSDSINVWEQAIQGVNDVIGMPNIADFFPIFKMVDPQGIKRKSELYFGNMLEMFDDLINQRMEYSKNRTPDSPKKNDLLQVLLDSNQESSDYNLSCVDIKHLLTDLIIGGSETTAITTEWTMTELLMNPRVMSIAKDELKTVLGENKQVQESEISKLPYLQAVIKEILRFHPPGPLLLPRTSEHDTEINGYLIPKNTPVLFNVWAMGRDPSLWKNPDSFEPERFLVSKVDFKGQNFELIPFGSGRRICPGLPLADRIVPLVVAYLIHNFDWVIQSGKDDTREKSGLFHRPAPLKALPTKA